MRHVNAAVTRLRTVCALLPAVSRPKDQFESEKLVQDESESAQERARWAPLSAVLYQWMPRVNEMKRGAQASSKKGQAAATLSAVVYLFILVVKESRPYSRRSRPRPTKIP